MLGGFYSFTMVADEETVPERRAVRGRLSPSPGRCRLGAFRRQCRESLQRPVGSNPPSTPRSWSSGWSAVGFRREADGPCRPIAALNFTNAGWPVLRTIALELNIIPRLRKPSSAHAIATNHSRFNRS